MKTNYMDVTPLAYDIKDLARICGRGKSVIWEEIGAGHLKARKAGGKTIVLHVDAVAWLEALPLWEPQKLAA